MREKETERHQRKTVSESVCDVSECLSERVRE